MTSRETPDFGAFLAVLARALGEAGLPFMLIGGQAVLLHGRPRLTEDIDITLGVDPGRLATVLEICRGLDLHPLPDDVESFVRRTFVLPVGDRETGMRVDFVFSTIPYERQAIERSVRVEVNGVDIPFAAAEDLIIHKIFAGRPRDREDALGVVRRQGNDLDWSYIEKWIREFAAVPGREAILDELEHLRDQAEGET
ncbi:MAG TPA: nucleotidyl transferase AbiEii/AbiGii toxin family protein [Gemmatimonadota bacterium]|nr:nucleotidyl transferase AbiEii/AbiGii toxin family protein [Gemmatimonadota bacterium]